MTTENMLAHYENKPAIIDLNGMTFKVIIKSARRRFGHIDLLVTPAEGEGEKWMEHHKVHLINIGTAWAHRTVVHLKN